MLSMKEITSRHQPTEESVTCSLRILRDDKWYQMQLLSASLDYCREVIRRLRSKGRTINVVFLTGMGLEEFIDNT